MALVSGKSGFSFWFQFCLREGVGVFLPPLKTAHLSGTSVWRPQSRYTVSRVDRVFLNLWFAKPMVCLRVAFHENDGNHENNENDEHNSDSYNQGVECWNPAGLAEITGTTKMTKTTGIQSANHGFPKPRV